VFSWLEDRLKVPTQHTGVYWSTTETWWGQQWRQWWWWQETMPDGKNHSSQDSIW